MRKRVPYSALSEEQKEKIRNNAREAYAQKVAIRNEQMLAVPIAGTSEEASVCHQVVPNRETSIARKKSLTKEAFRNKQMSTTPISVMWCILLQFFKSSIMKFIVCGSSIEHSYKHQPTNAVGITSCVFHVWLGCCIPLKLDILDCFNKDSMGRCVRYHLFILGSHRCVPCRAI
jgi:hypothetical protein